MAALAVSTPMRAADLPDVPTTVEAGYAQSDVTVWYGIFMPAKTPRAIIDRFHEAGTKVLATPATRQKLKQLVVDPMPMTPAQFRKLIADETEKWAKVVKFSGAKPD